MSEHVISKSPLKLLLVVGRHARLGGRRLVLGHLLLRRAAVSVVAAVRKVVFYLLADRQLLRDGLILAPVVFLPAKHGGRCGWFLWSLLNGAKFNDIGVTMLRRVTETCFVYLLRLKFELQNSFQSVFTLILPLYFSALPSWLVI